MKIWILTSEDHDGEHALYGAFSTPEKVATALARFIREQEHKVWESRGFGALETAPHLGEGESDVITCEKSYNGPDPTLDFAATHWEVRYHVVDALVD